MAGTGLGLEFKTVACRAMHRLSAVRVANLKEPGRYADGGGLYLFIDHSRRRWVFRYSWRAIRREIGLGSARTVPLAKAREKASLYRDLIANGQDPKALKAKTERRATFGDYADRYVETMSASWRSEKHTAQWKMTLNVYAARIRNIMVDEIDTADVLRVLRPQWSRVPETADRLRMRIEKVLDAAKVDGLRAGDNPARWRGHLDRLLPRLRRASHQAHHAALPFSEIKTFVAILRACEADAARMLEFLILTAARSGEVLGACWSEIDLEKKRWDVPAGRMKANRGHRVPLSEAAIDILMAVPEDKHTGLIFSQKDSRRFSNMAMPMLLRRMQRQCTVHGFRSTFRDWASELTSFPSEVCEMALAHVVTGKTEAAYRRGDLFEKRAKLMDAWARYCGYEF